MEQEKSISVLKLQLKLILTIVLAGTAAAPKVKLFRSVQNDEPLINAAFSPDGSTLVFGRQDSYTSRFLNAGNGPLLRTYYNQNNNTHNSAISSGGQYLAAGKERNGYNLLIFDAATGQRIGNRQGAHYGRTDAVSFSPDGQLVLTCGHQFCYLE